MNYPRSLAPWAPYLIIFPREVSLALGTLVQRLSAVIGSMRSRCVAGAGDVDGFHGVARRGSYERLVTSEWALADELPDEFARRAAMGEHLFLELARREPSAARVSLAIFDAGPNQLGSPRIAHIAALIALARRAEAAGARFGWGIAQQPEQPVLPGVATAEVRRLIEARSAREVTPDDLERWGERVADWPDLDDFWLIGGARVTPPGNLPGASWIRVQDVLEPEANHLSVTIQGASSGPKSLTLELPEARACARLLRDPFQDAKAPPRFEETAVAPTSNLIFSSSGAYLFARSSDGGILSYPVPESARAGRGKVRVYRSRYNDRIAAAGKVRRSMMLVRANDHAIKIEYAHDSRQAPGFAPGKYEIVHRHIDFASFAEDPSLQPCYRLPLQTRAHAELFVTDSERQLFRLGEVKGYRPTASDSVGSAWLVAREVLACAQQSDNQHLVYVGREVPDDNWRIVSIGKETLRRHLPFEGTPTNAFLAAAGSGIYGYFGALAIEQDHSTWWLTNGREDVPLTALFDSRIVGVSQVFESFRSLALIALESDRRTFALRDTTRHVEFHRASAPVEQVTVCAGSPKIGYATAEGEVVVYSLAQKEVVCRFLAEETP